MKLNLKSLICFAVISICSSTLFAANATIVSVTGKVEVNRNNTWVPLSVNSSISEGEIISTGFNSEALIRYNNSVMRLGPLTRITLEKLASSEKKDDVSVYVSTGAVRSTVKHTENKRVTYTVRNPVAVASVRGTDFLFIGTGKTTCYDGAVALSRGSSYSAKSRGVTAPADNSEPATPEEAVEAESKLPGDGMSTEDVNPYEKGGVLISAGQTSEIDTKTGNPKAPKKISEEKIESIKKQATTASTEEAENTGSNSPTEIVTKKPTSRKATLVITPKLED